MYIVYAITTYEIGPTERNNIALNCTFQRQNNSHGCDVLKNSVPTYATRNFNTQVFFS